MLFKIDENLPVEIAGLLVENGYDAATVHQQKMRGIHDNELILVCRDEQRILVSLDKDFTDIRTYPPQNFNGIIILRVHNQSKRNVINIFEQVIPKLKNEPIDKQLWIVEETKIRVRGKN